MSLVSEGIQIGEEYRRSLSVRCLRAGSSRLHVKETDMPGVWRASLWLTGGVCLEKQLPSAWYARNTSFIFNYLKILRASLDVYFQTMKYSLLNKLARRGRGKSGSFRRDSCESHVGMSDAPPHAQL